jgi:DNA-binding response OmpR family regulator
MQSKILYIEDEPTIAMAVTEALHLSHFEVIHVNSGEAALKKLENFSPDLCIIDVMLPRMDGFELAAEIKKVDGSIPLLFLTARTSLPDLLNGFEVGGDDYLKKPFSLAELLARVKVLVKRKMTAIPKEEEIYFKKYVFDRTNQALQLPNGEKCKLSYRETELLYLLLLHKNAILYRKQALLKIWKEDNFFNARNMDVFISRLRKYFNEDETVQIINIRGIGYKLVVTI